MGYESKIYFMRRFENSPFNWADEVATFDLCKLGYSHAAQEFISCFDTETDYGVWDYSEEKGEYLAREDCYGDALTYASDVPRLIAATKELIAETEAEDGQPYWRLLPFLAMLKAMAEYDDVQVVHYGY